MRTSIDLRLILACYILTFTGFLLSAQPAPSEDSCGTLPLIGAELDSFLFRHQQFQDEYDPGVGVPLHAGLRIVPIQIHIVTLGDGTGGIMEATIQTAIAEMNTVYQAAGLVFTTCSAPNIIMSDDLYEIEGYDEGDAMSAMYNVPNVINIYFVDSMFNDLMTPLCGWAYYPSSVFNDYVLMRNDCTNNHVTLIHELGHYYDLLHTHDTSFGIELVNGSNCTVAGDLFCSTPAEPQLSGLVNNMCMYTGMATDPNGDSYMPAVNNYMSYARWICVDNFTNEQIAKIAFTSVTSRANVSVLSCPDQTDYLDDNCQFILPDYRNSMTLHTDCPFVDTMQVPAPGTVINMDGSTEVTITVTDGNMDFASCTFTVYHIDTTSPVIAMIAPDTIVTDSDCNGIIGDYRDSTVVIDNCDPNPVITQMPPPGTAIGGVGDMQTVQIIAEDFNGNTSTIDINVTVIDAAADAELNCRNLNLSIGLNDQVRFRLDEMVIGANCSELHNISIENAYGAIVYQASDLVRNSIIAFLACDYIGQELKATVTNEAGTSCWGLLTIKQGNGPILTGRSFELWCYDERIADIEAYHKDFDYPFAYIPCKGYVQPKFVTDWIQPFECDPEVQDTAKIIYREYEAFDKSGLRSSVFDTIVVYRIPKLHFESFFCPGNQNIYCSDTSDFASPGLIFGNPALTGFVDLIDVRKNGKDLEFYPVELDTKCGLQVKVDYWKYGESSCEQQYKIAVEVKQSCPGTLSNLVVSVISPNSFLPLDADGTYWRCEFWVTNQDTTPPLIADKVIGEYECLVIDTNDLLDGNFLDNFVPLVSTSIHSCDAHTLLPPVCVYDDWSGIKLVKATIEGIGSFIMHPTEDTCVIFDASDGAFSFGGDFTDQILDQLMSQFGDTIPEEILEQIKFGTCYRSDVKVLLPMKETPYLVIYEVMDSCHIIGRDTALIKVKDQVAPIAVADKGVNVSLTDKKIWVDANSFDEGSWDNCGIEFILARRSDWKEACIDLSNNYDQNCESKEDALCWLWTDGHDTLWTVDLEKDKHCDEVEAYYQKQLDWFCEDGSSCGSLLYNSWMYDLIKYATIEVKGDGQTDVLAFEKLFKRAVVEFRETDHQKITNDSLLDLLQMIPEVVFIDSNHVSGSVFGLDLFKCEQVLNNYCLDLFDDNGFNGSIFDDPLLIQFLLSEGCSSNFDFAFPFPEFFVPALLPEDLQNNIFDNWKNIGGGWSDAVPFSCEDACGPVTVEILVMDYWCNWSTAWTTVWVEDLTPVEVVKDVVEEAVITCKVYKENNYSYPGEDHPVSIQHIIDQAQIAERDAYDALDDIFGGYVKAWRDPYGNYVDSAGVEIECDIPFYDSICECKDSMVQIRVYDEHLGYLWIDSLVKECYYDADTLTFQKGVVAVNCAENVYCEQEVWSELDHCGQGYIFRKFKIWQSCPVGSYDGMPDSIRHPVDTIYRHQRIWVGNACPLDKSMFDVPYDTVVYSCDIEYGSDGNVIGDAGPENTGNAKYKFDDDCRLVGIAHEDKVFKIVGGEEACYKIIRTWYFADWCGTDGASIPTGKWWLDDNMVRDKCVQKIIVKDTIAPICLITGPVETGDSVSLAACDYDLTVTVDASDACGVIGYYWELKDITNEGDHTLFDAGNGALDGDEEDNFNISSHGLSPGTYKLKVQIKDDCSNESYCEYIITVTSGKKPSPVCLSSITARLTPWDSDGDGEADTAHAIVWAYEYDRSSEPACEDDSLEYRLEILDGTEDDATAAGDLDFLEVGCDDIGTHLVRFWVISHPSGSRDYCDAVLVVQSDGSGCPTSVNGEQVLATEGERAISTKASAQKNLSAGDLSVAVSGEAFGSGIDHIEGYSLDQNSPNPFKYETQIGFTLPKSMSASIEVFDVTGRMVKSIRGSFTKGYNTVQILSNELQGTGVLYYRLQAENFTAMKRMIVIE